MKKELYRFLPAMVILCLMGCGSPRAEGPDVIGSDAKGPDGEMIEVPDHSIGDGEKTEVPDNIIGDDNKQEPEPTEPIPNEGTIGEFRYSISSTMEYIGDSKARGYYVLTYPENRYFVYVICSGEQSTGGYDIDVSKLKLDDDGNLIVSVKETEPGAMDMVTEALTYPRITMRISMPADPDKRIIIQTEDGKEFPFLGNLEEQNAEISTGAGKKDDAPIKDSPNDTKNDPQKDSKNYPQKDTKNDSGELYAKEPTGDDIVTSSDGMEYVKNQILISAKMDCTREQIEKLGRARGFEVVGYIEITQDYQVEYAREMTEEDLLREMKILQEEDYISSCSFNYVTDLYYDLDSWIEE